MKMFIALFTLLLFCEATLIPEKSASYWKKADKNLNRIFQGATFTKKEVDFSRKEWSKIDLPFANHGIYQLYHENELLGYLVLTASMGRYESFDYMVVYDPELSVKEIDVLNYTSSHGGEVASRNWLKQFAGYNGKHLTYGKDIEAITGATYSAGSLTKDVETITVLLKNNQALISKSGQGGY